MVAVLAMLACPAFAAGPQPILQVEVEEAAGVVTVRDLRVTTGYPDPVTAGPHRIEVLDAAGNAVVDRSFKLRHLVDVPPAAGGAHDAPVFIDRASLTVNLPLPGGALTVRVMAGRMREEFHVPSLPIVRQVLPPPQLLWQGCADENQCFKFLYIGDKYTQPTLGSYGTTAQAIATFFLGIQPYLGVKDQINIYKLDNLTDLGCTYNCAGIQRLICCSDATVSSVAAAAPHDEILVVVNDAEYGGSGSLDYTPCFDASTIAVTYNDISGTYGANWTAKHVAVHETGHSMAGLWDEYEYQQAGNYGDGPNCVHDSTCALWSGTAGTGCFAGCSYDGMYRPTQNSCLMNTFDAPGGFKFCPVCINHFQAKVASCIGGSVTCTTPPTSCYDPNGQYVGGQCQYTPLATNTPCDDGDACTSGDHCDGAGTCAGTPLSCATPPNAQCYQTPGACYGNGCEYTPKADLTPCNDSDPCTKNDRCDGKGACKGTADPSCGQDGGVKDGGPDAGAPVDAGKPDAGVAKDGGASGDAAVPTDAGKTPADGGAKPKDAGGGEASCACDTTYACDEGCDCDPECAGDASGAGGTPAGCSCSSVSME